MLIKIAVFVLSISVLPLSLAGIYDGIAAPAAISYAAPTKLIAAAAPAITYSAPAVAAAPVKVAAAAVPIATSVVKAVAVEPYDPNPQYSFSYGVSDQSTGDSKAAQETLINGVVHGSYSLTEADGSVRKVTYTADNINGFNAVVQKSGGAIALVKPVAAVATVPATITKVAYAAPAIAKTIYSSPSFYHH